MHKTHYGAQSQQSALAFENSLLRKIRADKEFVFDWWTDLSSKDSQLVKPLKQRYVVSKSPTIIMLQDEEEMYFKKMKFDVKVSLERPDRWISEYDGKSASARSEYTLKSNQDGSTTLHYHTKIQPKGALTSFFSPVVKPFVKHVFAGEMKIFIRTLEEEYAELGRTKERK